MARFSDAVEVLLDFEGREVTGDVGDGAGTTAFGITLRYLREAHPDAEESDLAGMDIGTAKTLYEVVTWNRLRLGQIEDQRVATRVLLDAVNFGALPAARILQTAINIVGATRVEVDGIVGPATVAGANASDSKRLLIQLQNAARRRYVAIVAANPDRERFLRGWLRRAAWPDRAEV